MSTASSGLEMVCLHSLTSEAARRLSLPVISGVWQTSFEVAKSLVDDGEAAKEDSNPSPTLTPTLILALTLAPALALTLAPALALTQRPNPSPHHNPNQAAKEDFCVFAGYAGWGPTQLQGEVERDYSSNPKPKPQPNAQRQPQPHPNPNPTPTPNPNPNPGRAG